MKKKKQRIRQIKYNYFTFTVWLNSFTKGLFNFQFHTRMSASRKETLFMHWWTESSMIYLQKQRIQRGANRQAGWYKACINTLFSLRRVFALEDVGHESSTQGACLRRSKLMWQIPLACLRKRYGYTREFINVSDSELPIYYIEGIRITSQAFILLKTHSDSQQFTLIVTTTEMATRATSKSRKF